MSQDAYPTLNGFAPSFSDIATTFSIYEGEQIEDADYQDISWSDEVEVGEQRGPSGGRIMKRTRGQLKSDASATFYRSGLRRFIRGLAKKAPLRGNQRIISVVGFDIVIHHATVDDPEIYTTKIKGCRLLGRSVKMAEGPDADKVEVKLNPIQIVEIIDGEEIVLL